jgi:hypothetical protein
MVLFAAVEWIDLLFLCLTSLKWEGSYSLKPIIFAKCFKKNHLGLFVDILKRHLPTRK